MVLAENNKRVHVELNRRGITNAWMPTMVCTKDACKVEGENYATYNEKSKRFHGTGGPQKGKFAKGTKGPPIGLVTSNKERSKWKNPETGSPRSDPFEDGEPEAGAPEKTGGIVEGGGTKTAVNAQGEHVQVTANLREDGMEEIDYTAEKKNKDLPCLLIL